ncbi:MAG TPA: hypothetical protein VHU83_23505 [Bryobacteraceae bacterium]|jgi:hypothetical protein|nr:hypothetical protein [Bryobacteraceae bacterium]
MENELLDLEFAEDLCRLDEQAERSRAISLERCGLIVTNSIEWLPATEWVKSSSQA